MKINKLNYETYIIDYLEDQLSAADRKEFETYIQLHPEVKDEIDEYLKAPILTEDVSMTYNNKESDKKKRSGFLWLIIGLLLLLILSLILIGVWASNTFNSKEVLDKNLKKPETESVIEIKKPTTAIAVIENQENEKLDDILKDNKSDNTKDIVLAETPNKIIENIDLIVDVEQHKHDDSERHEIRYQSPIVSTNDATDTYVSEKNIIRPKLRSKNEVVEIPTIQALAMNDGFNRTRLIEMVVVNKKTTKKKKTGLKKTGLKLMFVPQSYKDIDLKESVASLNLKSAAKDIEKNIVPNQFINR